MVEQQWLLYAKMVFQGQVKPNSVQYIECRRVFYGAWGQCLFYLQQDLVNDEKNAIDHLNQQIAEIGQFWHHELSRRDSKN